MREIGRKDCPTATEGSFTTMGPFTKAASRTEWLSATRRCLSGKMAAFIEEISSTIKPMGTASSHLPNSFTRAIGLTIFPTARPAKFTAPFHFMKASLYREWKRGREYTNGMQLTIMSAISTRINLRERETSLQRITPTKASLKKEKKKASALILIMQPGSTMLVSFLQIFLMGRAS